MSTQLLTPQNQVLQIVSRELLLKDRPERKPARFKEGFKLTDKLRQVGVDPVSKSPIVEFIGTDDFNASWYSRQRYEVDNGRDREPLLYPSIYDITEDSGLPRNVPIFRIGPAGVVFERIEEGGEVKFVTVGSSDISVPIYQYATGLEYDKGLLLFNELWSMGIVERQLGTAFNALLNHIHFYPILNYTYIGDNQTDGTSLDYEDAEILPTRYLRTLEAAITHASDDTDNPRRGPYVLLCSTSNFFTMERALTAVFQQGTTLQSSAIGQITQLIAYNGWSGSRGKKQVSYGGVPANTCYLIDTGYRERNFKSFVKQGLLQVNGNPDISRFILEQTVWDTWFGVFADPAAAVEEVTLPTISA
jgi:hypothetical protein